MGRKRTRKVDVRQEKKFAKDYRGCTIAIGGSGSLRGMQIPIKRLWREKLRFKVIERLTDVGISYAGLADRLSEKGMETSKSAVGAWMDGRNEPGFATIKGIGEIIGMSITEIFGEDLYLVKDPLTRQIVQRLDNMSDDDKRGLLKFLGIDPDESVKSDKYPTK